MSSISGIIGGIVAVLILNLLVSRASRKAMTVGDKKVLKYGSSVRVLGWILLLVCLFITYAASQASANQRVLAWCMGIGFLLMGSAFLLEVYFVRIFFDGDYIYTFSPWRPSRKIPWVAISGHAFSDINKWHILKTNSFGEIRLSILLSGLGSLSQELKKRKLPFF